MNNLDKLINRLSKIGIDIEVSGNYLFSLDKINGVKVKETYLGSHGFTVAWLQLMRGKEIIILSDIKEIFKLIRKYGYGRNNKKNI